MRNCVVILSVSLFLQAASVSWVLADSHRECQSFSCVVVPTSGPSQCSFDADCNTECSVNGVGTGDIYAGNKCGACTSGACAGKELGDECTVTVGMASATSSGGYTTGDKKKKGKCGASQSCSAADPGGKNYAGACGMACACDLAPDSLEALCRGDPWCEGVAGSLF